MASSKPELLHGPYQPPALHRGDRTTCLYRDAEVVITSWTDARIPWPRCRSKSKRNCCGRSARNRPKCGKRNAVAGGQADPERSTRAFSMDRNPNTPSWSEVVVYFRAPQGSAGVPAKRNAPTGVNGPMPSVGVGRLPRGGRCLQRPPDSLCYCACYGDALTGRRLLHAPCALPARDRLPSQCRY
jgi:hypothetical protein